MNRFDYLFPVRIHFGQGCFEDSLKQELQKYGNKERETEAEDIAG